MFSYPSNRLLLLLKRAKFPERADKLKEKKENERKREGEGKEGKGKGKGREGKEKPHSRECFFPDACALPGSPLTGSCAGDKWDSWGRLCHFSDIWIAAEMS